MKLRVSGTTRRPISLRTLLMRTGRVVLWLVVAVLLARGVASVAARDDRPAGPRTVRAAVEWPDEAARAWAVEFAAAYLTLDPRDPLGRRELLANVATPDVVEAGAVVDAGSRRQTVVSATVERATRVDERRALVTVAARMSGGPARTVAWTPSVLSVRPRGLGGRRDLSRSGRSQVPGRGVARSAVIAG